MKFVKNKWVPILKWWIFFVLLNVATTVLFLTGIAQTALEVDITNISFLIYGLFYIFSVRQGILIYKFSKSVVVTKKDIYYYQHKNEPAWYISNLLLNLGLFGTIIGFIYMLAITFGGLGGFDIIAAKESISQMINGMGTALYTTAAGMACSILLRWQLFDFSHYMDSLSENYGYGEENENTENL